MPGKRVLSVTRLHSSNARCLCRGHSLIEMLVVLIIVAILIAVVVPAVQRSRESARMAQCIHNQGQLAQAVHLHVTDDPFGRFPGFRAFGADGTTVIGWAPQVFEYLGRSDLPTDPTQAKYVEVLVCPSDQRPKDTPRLNYVVNGGRAGTDSPADGVFFDHAKDEKVFITKDDFADGLTNTIMLAENLDATKWDDASESNQCILWPLVEGNEINNGTGARPSSHHPGGFVAAFADGSVKFMNDVHLNEDPAVHGDGSLYAALLTPGGDDAPDTEIVGVDPCDPINEETLDKSLNWIVNHQFYDGHWSLAHSTHPDCNGSCGHDGTAVNKVNAATGLALLPLLGAGSTPVSGPYREAVCRGIEYLMSKQDSATGSLAEDDNHNRGSTYSHLVANLALAEALLLANEAQQGGCVSGSSGPDPCSIDINELRMAVEKATAYTSELQVPYVDDATQLNKGGWRYHYQGGGNGSEPWAMGDLSHAVWALAALKTAEKVGVSVPQDTYDGAKAFLNLVGSSPVSDQGSTIDSEYSYRVTGAGADWNLPRPRMTTIGLLSQIYLGTSPQHQAVRDFVPTITPVTSADTIYPVYMNMHATQLLYLADGPEWSRWSQQIQDLVLPAQHTAADGHEEGSWDADSPAGHSSDTTYGGRLYVTVMYSLCLETHFAGLKLGR